MKIKIRKTSLLLLLTGTLFLPIFSFYLGSRTSLFYENITYVGTMKEYRILFLFWGIANSLYYMIVYLRILHHASTLHALRIPVKPLCLFFTGISICAFLSPYTLDSGDLFSQFHVYGAMSSCIGTIVLLFYTLEEGIWQYFQMREKAKTYLFGILLASCMLLVVIGDISTIMELVLLNGLNYIMAYILYQLEKSHK